MIMNLDDALHVFGGDDGGRTGTFIGDRAAQMHDTITDNDGEANGAPVMFFDFVDGSGTSRARLATACSTLDRETIPTSLPARMTGTRLMLFFSMRETRSGSGVSSLTVIGEGVMISDILRPCSRT